MYLAGALVPIDMRCGHRCCVLWVQCSASVCTCSSLRLEACEYLQLGSELLKGIMGEAASGGIGTTVGM